MYNQGLAELPVATRLASVEADIKASSEEAHSHGGSSIQASMDALRLAIGHFGIWVTPLPLLIHYCALIEGQWSLFTIKFLLQASLQ